ncbi:hypothetical protein SAMN05444358_101718 [Ruegeria halocynthiae]|uniref:Uncharacterized protein n=1 Tax=Ruegeria halocynthiae TaxID=985054 RepID=A0A1H2T9G6_9RHOB|nr:hypothetical protein SAMN05444358_101718 [Ruegeria halocynthiae]
MYFSISVLTVPQPHNTLDDTDSLAVFAVHMSEACAAFAEIRGNVAIANETDKSLDLMRIALLLRYSLTILPYTKPASHFEHNFLFLLPSFKQTF